MVVPGAQVLEALAAGLAVIGCLPGVDSHVDSEVIFLTKLPSALIALQQKIRQSLKLDTFYKICT